MARPVKKFPKKGSRKHGLKTILCKTSKCRKQSRRRKQSIRRKQSRRTGRRMKGKAGMMKALTQMHRTTRDVMASLTTANVSEETGKVKDLLLNATALTNNITTVGEALNNRNKEITEALQYLSQAREDSSDQYRTQLARAYSRSLSQPAPTDEDTMKELKKWNNELMENIIISWKQENPLIADEYEQFLQDVFPENIRVSGDDSMTPTVDIDARVLGSGWRAVFEAVFPEQALHNQGPPPGVSMEEEKDDDWIDVDIAEQINLDQIEADLGRLQHKFNMQSRRFSYYDTIHRELMEDINRSTTQLKPSVEDIQDLQKRVRDCNKEVDKIRSELLTGWDMPPGLAEMIAILSSCTMKQMRNNAEAERDAYWATRGVL